MLDASRGTPSLCPLPQEDPPEGLAGPWGQAVAKPPWPPTLQSQASPMFQSPGGQGGSGSLA